MEVQVTEEVRRFLLVNTGYGSGYGSGSGDGDGYGSGYGDGSGYGYGDGYGYGSGYGDGYGYGSGYGSGYGYGYGYGYGSGYGYGYGYGDGYGSGDGDGYGSGYGSGDGYGLNTLDGKAVHIIDGVQTIIESVHGTYARGWIVQVDLTLEPCYIAKMGNCFAHGETLRKAQADAQAKYEQNMPLAERIDSFKQQYPTLDTEATAEDLYRWHGVLTGSCRMGRDSFCRGHGITMADAMTVRRFIDLTKDAYGGDAIRQLAEQYQR